MNKKVQVDQLHIRTFAPSRGGKGSRLKKNNHVLTAAISLANLKGSKPKMIAKKRLTNKPATAMSPASLTVKIVFLNPHLAN